MAPLSMPRGGMNRGGGHAISNNKNTSLICQNEKKLEVVVVMLFQVSFFHTDLTQRSQVHILTLLYNILLAYECYPQISVYSSIL